MLIGDAGFDQRSLPMSLELKDIRPAVISHALYLDLLNFLGFRHVVRQAYGFQLDPRKLEELEKIFVKTWKRSAKEIKRFCLFF